MALLKETSKKKRHFKLAGILHEVIYRDCTGVPFKYESKHFANEKHLQRNKQNICSEGVK
jgi:hypothetical protein